MDPIRLAAVAAFAALGACEGPSSDAPPTAASSSAQAAPSPVTSDTPEPGPAADSPGRPSAEPGFTSEYTRFDLGRCTVTSRAAEGEFVEYTCPGRGDIALLAALGDGRMDLDAGVRNERFEGLSAFNDIGTQIEWRLHGGVPAAIIFRYRDATPEGRAAGRSVLAVEKVGRAGAPGCRVAQLAGSTAQVNQRARDIADRTAPGFACGRDRVTYIGNAR